MEMLIECGVKKCYFMIQSVAVNDKQLIFHPPHIKYCPVSRVFARGSITHYIILSFPERSHSSHP